MHNGNEVVEKEKTLVTNQETQVTCQDISNERRKALKLDFRQLHPFQHPIILNLTPLLVLLPSQTLLLANYDCEKLLHVNPNSVTIPPYLLHYIAKIHANIHWDLKSLTLSIEPEHVFQYCTRNIAARWRHIQFYYKSIAFYSACVLYRKVSYRSQNFQYVSYREACVSLHP